MYGDYPTEIRRDRRDEPPVTIYFTRGDADYMEKLSCMFCKRTICDFKGRVDKVVTNPTDLDNFGVAFNIQCKLCHCNYRLVVYDAYVIHALQVYTEVKS